MDLWQGMALLAGGVALILLIILLTRRQGASPELADLAGRLNQISITQTTGQNTLSERLQAQERALAQVLENRLTLLGQTVDTRLKHQVETTQKSLTELKERLAVIDAAQRNITELSGHVSALQMLLSNKQARGVYGEVQMRDLVQTVLPPSAFAFQCTLSTRARVDCLLKLPNPPGSIAVDAKFPLEAFRALQEAADDLALKQAQKKFSDDVRLHIAAIAEKYIIPGETADSALMFVPSEAVYAEIHARFPNLVDESFRRRVWIVSPTTLMATLTTIRAVLNDAKMHEQAHLIQREVGLMLQDAQRLAERVFKLESHFSAVQKDVNDVRISTNKITTRAERIGQADLDAPTLAVLPGVKLPEVS